MMLWSGQGNENNVKSIIPWSEYSVFKSCLLFVMNVFMRAQLPEDYQKLHCYARMNILLLVTQDMF